MRFFDLEYQILINRYKRWRELGMRLNQKIVKEIPQDVMLEAAEDLHMLGKERMIIFDSENEKAYLVDRAIFDIERQGKRCIEHFLEKYRDTVSPREKRLLEAMKNSAYSLFLVDKIERGMGADIADAFFGEKLFLFDLNMSQTLSEGCLVSCRIISIDNIHFTSGCACVFERRMLSLLKNNFINLFEKKKDVLPWQQMMRKYNPYFLRMMRQSGKEVHFL